jgi:hypothetical protein
MYSCAMAGIVAAGTGTGRVIQRVIARLTNG